MYLFVDEYNPCKNGGIWRKDSRDPPRCICTEDYGGHYCEISKGELDAAFSMYLFGFLLILLSFQYCATFRIRTRTLTKNFDTYMLS